MPEILRGVQLVGADKRRIADAGIEGVQRVELARPDKRQPIVPSIFGHEKLQRVFCLSDLPAVYRTAFVGGKLRRRSAPVEAHDLDNLAAVVAA